MSHRHNNYRLYFYKDFDKSASNCNLNHRGTNCTNRCNIETMYSWCIYDFDLSSSHFNVLWVVSPRQNSFIVIENHYYLACRHLEFNNKPQIYRPFFKKEYGKKMRMYLKSCYCRVTSL